MEKNQKEDGSFIPLNSNLDMNRIREYINKITENDNDEVITLFNELSKEVFENHNDLDKRKNL